jgi:DNA/RNA-binding domain of Phe-tRNA-synthetase-like protein
MEALGVSDDPRDLRGAGAERPVGDAEVRRGWTAPEVAAEFPELALHTVSAPARSAGRSPRAVRDRLALLSNRFRGAQAVNLRRAPVPAAYRVFFHHIGLDPDTTRTPVEAAIVDRMLHGGFKSRNLLDDALLIATVETGVPLWALDSTAVDGPLGIRLAGDEEPFGRAPEATPLPGGRLVVADPTGVVAILFGEVAPGHGVSPQTSDMTVFAVQVGGVPSIHVEEALWSCLSVLEAGP